MVHNRRVPLIILLHVFYTFLFIDHCGANDTSGISDTTSDTIDYSGNGSSSSSSSSNVEDDYSNEKVPVTTSSIISSSTKSTNAGIGIIQRLILLEEMVLAIRPEETGPELESIVVPKKSTPILSAVEFESSSISSSISSSSSSLLSSLLTSLSSDLNTGDEIISSLISGTSSVSVEASDNIAGVPREKNMDGGGIFSNNFDTFIDNSQLSELSPSTTKAATPSVSISLESVTSSTFNDTAAAATEFVESYSLRDNQMEIDTKLGSSNDALENTQVQFNKAEEASTTTTINTPASEEPIGTEYNHSSPAAPANLGGSNTLLSSSNLSNNASLILNDDPEDLSPNFLSFEEWVQKKTNVKDQQSSQKHKSRHQDSVAQSGGSGGGSASSRDKETDYSVGEENEIDFDLFTPKNSFNEQQENKGYKNRFNFASLDCAATIVKANAGAKGASSVLLENKESYLLNQCNAQENFIIIELCEDILIDSVMIGNYEFFSSIFKNLEFYVSDRYPVPNSKWQLLGKFEARNIRDIQSFVILNPLIWARYLKIEIKSHYGNEFYCPVSIVRVHGRTMMEEYKLKESEEKREIEKAAVNEAIMAAEQELEEKAGEVTETNSTNEKSVYEAGSNAGMTDNTSDAKDPFQEAKPVLSGSQIFASTVASNTRMLVRESHVTAPEREEQQATGTTLAHTSSVSGDEEIEADGTNNTCIDQKAFTEFEKFLQELKRNESCEPLELLESSKAAKKAAARAREIANNSHINSNNTNSYNVKSFSAIPSKRSEPVTQESIYKNIMKRLSLLESNASLSLLYVEEQSKLLSEAFTKLEKKQSLKFNLLVMAINDTFQNQLNEFKEAFETFKKDSQAVLDDQEEVTQKTYAKIDRNFDRLVNELQFQKKIVILLFIIVVCLLVYVILTRDTLIEGEYLDEIVNDEASRYGYIHGNNSAASIQEDKQKPNLAINTSVLSDDHRNDSFNGEDSPSILHSPQFNVAMATGVRRNSYNNSEAASSPLYKRKLKLKFSNKFGSLSSSTILLDDGIYGHRKTPSNGSGSSYASENPAASGASVISGNASANTSTNNGLSAGSRFENAIEKIDTSSSTPATNPLVDGNFSSTQRATKVGGTGIQPGTGKRSFSGLRIEIRPNEEDLGSESDKENGKHESETSKQDDFEPGRLATPDNSDVER